MAVDKKYYDILGVNENATQDDIKKAFKSKSKKLHPDRNQGDPNATQKFQELNTANQVLSDPEKRKLYDQFGPDLGKNLGRNQQGDFDPFDVMERMRRAYGFGGVDPRENANISVSINMAFEDVYKKETSTKTFKYNRKIKCDTCNLFASASLTNSSIVKGVTKSIRVMLWCISLPPL